MAWRVDIFDDTVVAELDAWPVKVRAALDKIVERIETLGLDRLHAPHVKHLEGKLWELRANAGGDDGRALHVAVSGRRVVIVAAFLKKSRKTPKRWLDLAEERARGVR